MYLPDSNVSKSIYIMHVKILALNKYEMKLFYMFKCNTPRPAYA